MVVLWCDMHFRIQRFEIVVLHYVDCTEIREIVCFHSYEYIALKHFKLARDIQASFVVLELCTGDLHMNFASNKLSEVMCFFSHCVCHFNFKWKCFVLFSRCLCHFNLNWIERMLFEPTPNSTKVSWHLRLIASSDCDWQTASLESHDQMIWWHQTYDRIRQHYYDCIRWYTTIAFDAFDDTLRSHSMIHMFNSLMVIALFEFWVIWSHCLSQTFDDIRCCESSKC